MKQRTVCRSIIVAAFISIAALSPARAEPVLHHVHGLAFTPDGKGLVVPAHIGLAVYRDGRWTKAPGPAHDFMGFSMAKNAIYSSGHPAMNTPLKNPLGLVKSTDGGNSWQQLGLSGESDFHMMAASYGSNAIYVFNTDSNSRMRETGLYVTQDDGKSWKRGAGSGLAGQITSLAAHPGSASTVAMGTVQGLHLSRDYGATFKRIGATATVTAVTFDIGGKHVFFTTDKLDGLHNLALDGTQSAAVSLPPLERDFVLYIAQNPAKAQELAIATRKRDVYLSRDSGKTWQQIAREGEAGDVASRQTSSVPRKSAAK
jgi:phosphoribosyl-AMP cyclohydrolase